MAEEETSGEMCVEEGSASADDHSAASADDHSAASASAEQSVESSVEAASSVASKDLLIDTGSERSRTESSVETRTTTDEELSSLSPVSQLWFLFDVFVKFVLVDREEKEQLQISRNVLLISVMLNHVSNSCLQIVICSFQFVILQPHDSPEEVEVPGSAIQPVDSSDSEYVRIDTHSDVRK